VRVSRLNWEKYSYSLLASSSQKSSESVSKHGQPPSSWSSAAVPIPQLSSAVIQDLPVIAPIAGGMDEDVHWSITTAERRTYWPSLFVPCIRCSEPHAVSGDTDSVESATGDTGVAAWEGTLFGPSSSLTPSFGDFGSIATYPVVAAPEPVCGPTERGKHSPLVTDYGPVGVESPTSEPSAGATPPVTGSQYGMPATGWGSGVIPPPIGDPVSVSCSIQEVGGRKVREIDLPSDLARSPVRPCFGLERHLIQLLFYDRKTNLAVKYN
jgi:hypothetical protein